MTTLIKRMLTGTVYVAIVVISVLYTDWAFPLLCALFGITGIVEFRKLTHTVGSSSVGILSVDLIFGTLILISTLLSHAICIPEILLTGLCFLLYILFRLTLQLYINSDSPIIDTGKSVLSFCWIILPLVCLERIFISYRMLVLVLFIMIWLNDTGAFCAGSLFGRHKLFERISPKKTWEGWFGGLIITSVFGWFVPDIPIFDSLFSNIQSLFMSVIVCVAATYGDLAESLLKRTMHVKDSGNILPGHGGILDRIDSLLFAAPATTIMLIALYLC